MGPMISRGAPTSPAATIALATEADGLAVLYCGRVLIATSIAAGLVLIVGIAAFSLVRNWSHSISAPLACLGWGTCASSVLPRQ